MANKRTPLVLWSGGLDSTFLMWHLLQTSDVSYVVLAGGQTAGKKEAEAKARTKALAWFEEHTPFKAIEVVSRAHINLAGIPEVSWSQPAAWLIGALGALDSTKHHSVQLAYVLGDEILSMQEYLQDTWDGLQGLCKRAYTPLLLPLRLMEKPVIMSAMPKELYDCIWYCESPRDEQPCGNYCSACITHRTALYKMELYKRTIGCDPNHGVYDFHQRKPQLEPQG